ncbi:hypothetical protein AAKU55_003387 [Oxalobacteraceae bacterium GrIS 1.11]
MVIPPSRAGTGKYSAFVRWNEHLGIGLLRRHRLCNRVAVVRAIAPERRKRCRNFTEQIRYCRRVADFRRRQFARKNLMMFIDLQVQLAPGVASGNVMFLLASFISAVDFEHSGAGLAWHVGWEKGAVARGRRDFPVLLPHLPFIARPAIAGPASDLTVRRALCRSQTMRKLLSCGGIRVGAAFFIFLAAATMARVVASHFRDRAHHRSAAAVRSHAGMLFAPL